MSEEPRRASEVFVVVDVGLRVEVWWRRVRARVDRGSVDGRDNRA